MWEAKFAPDAKADLKRLDKAFAMQVLKGIAKVRKNPLPRPDGYGKPLGNKVMNILVISKRDDEYCYEAAIKLYQKYGDSIFDDIFKQ